MARTTKDTRQRDAAAPEELDPRLVKAISHPLRHRILVRLNEDVLSPNDLASELGESLGRVSYHVRTLADAGAIELVRTVPRRGAVQHFYRAVVRAWFSDQDWERLPRTTRRTIFGQHLGRIWADAVAAAQADGFDHPQAHVSFSWVDLDAQGMTDVADLLRETLERALAIQAASVDRLAGADPEHRTELAILHFERAPEG
jgi:DNA-binding transcriptional ArsR family regulator